MSEKTDNPRPDENAGPEVPDDLMKSWDPGQTEVLQSFNLGSSSALSEDSIRLTSIGGFAHTVALDATQSPPNSPDEQPPPALTMVKPLGKGGFGEVWEARQNQLGRAVAVKVIRRDICPSRDSSDARHQFVDTNLRQEALTAAMLDHPNIVPVYDLQEDERGFPALAMKLVRGHAWDTVIREDFPAMPAEDFLARHITILVSVAQAVAFAHSRGIIHRDLKPAQVMLGDFGEVLLMDWGLATVFDHPRLSEATQAPPVAIMPSLESASNPAGTLSYMAPEQTDSTTSRIGPWTDTYLLGGILYHLLCGGPPRSGSNVNETLKLAREGYVRPLAEAAPDRHMPPELISLCQWCMQPDPATRPQHAGEVLEALKAYQSGAGKRQQSRELASEAQAALSSAGADYAQLSKCEELVGRAFELWPENPQLAELSSQLRVNFASAAIDKGDLELAQLHAARAGDSDKPLLLNRIDSARRLHQRKERERRIARTLAIAALLIIVVGTLYYNHRVNQALATAVTARSEAEKLIAGLQENLFGELDAIGKMGILADLGEEIDAYFDQMEKGDKTGNSQLRHVRSLLTLQQAQMRIGKKKEARETSTQAVKQAKQLVASNPRNQNYLAMLACAQTRLAGQLYLSETPVDTVLAQVAEGMETLRTMQDEKITDPELATLAAKAGENISRLVVVVSGNTTSSTEVLERSNAIRERMLARHPKNPVLLRGKAEHLIARTQTYIGTGKLQESVDSMLRAREIYRVDLAGSADEPGLNAELAMINYWLGHAYERQGETTQALDAHTVAMNMRKQLVTASPDDFTWRWNLAFSEAKVAELNIDSGNIEAATALIQSAMKVLDDGSTTTSRSRDFYVAAGVAKVTQGRLLELNKQPEEARQKWTEAVNQFRAVESSAPYEYFMLRYLLEGLLRLDRTKEADEVAGKLRTLGYKASRTSEMLQSKGLAPL